MTAGGQSKKGLAGWEGGVENSAQAAFVGCNQPD